MVEDICKVIAMSYSVSYEKVRELYDSTRSWDTTILLITIAHSTGLDPIVLWNEISN